MHRFHLLTTVVFTTTLVTLQAQDRQGGPPRGQRGPGGPPAAVEELKILNKFDKDDSGHLDLAERKEARAFLKENPAPKRGGGGGGGGRGGRGSTRDDSPPKPGAKISPEDVESTLAQDLYDRNTLRTLFLTFENEDWEQELEAFHNTDADVPATLAVDGKSYENVGIRFRGASSYFRVPAGRKRSFNISLNMVHKDQRLNGYKTLNLLNCNGDASFLSAVLSSDISRKYIPAPKANLMRVVINGENWGIYANQQQFNTDFLLDNYKTSKGARWKVPGSPRGQGGLDDKGDKLEEYKKHYDMKGGDEEDWKALIKLSKTLSNTPLEELEAALEPQLNIDNALWFLALDCAFINSDGYWTRASDYTIYRGKDGRFNLIPHDMNESFRPSRRGGTGLGLDPFVASDDEKKPLRSRLLAVPALRESYLKKIKHIAKHDLDWKKLGPSVAAYRELIGDEIAADTRKSTSTEQFEILTADSPDKNAESDDRTVSLRAFAEGRSKFLLESKGD